MQAVFYGDADEVRALLYKKEDVNSTVSNLCINIKFVYKNVFKEKWCHAWNLSFNVAFSSRCLFHSFQYAI